MLLHTEIVVSLASKVDFVRFSLLLTAVFSIVLCFFFSVEVHPTKSLSTSH